MRVPEITLHTLNDAELIVHPEDIGSRREVNEKLGDNPKGKSVIEVDGSRYVVKETLAEIAQMIEKLEG